MKKLHIYGTLGPACCQKDQLKHMLEAGMTGMRLNLSHANLKDCQQWLDNYQLAQKECHIKADLLIDMKGPELRIGNLINSIELCTNTHILIDQSFQFPNLIYEHIQVGNNILLDDGKILLKVENVHNQLQCVVVRGGILKSHKSIAIEGLEISSPTLTDSDIENLKQARKYGVTGLMQPFVRNSNDLINIKHVLHQLNLDDIKIFAKIENKEGYQNLQEILPYADCIVIARGDLGNAFPLYELPKIQKHIENICNHNHKPYMVVTQMLDSMHHKAVPTRAEVNDIFYAVYHGASHIMLTGETAIGSYPLESMEYFVKTSEIAYQEKEKDIL